MIKNLTVYPLGDTLFFMSAIADKKTAYIRARVRPQIKHDAERVLHKLGISTTDAISVFLKQVSLQGGLPFAVKVPNERTLRAFAEGEHPGKLKRYADTKSMLDDLWPKSA